LQVVERLVDENQAFLSAVHQWRNCFLLLKISVSEYFRKWEITASNTAKSHWVSGENGYIKARGKVSKLPSRKRRHTGW
jgi:hypothetical protein